MWLFSKRAWCSDLFKSAVCDPGERGLSIQVVKPVRVLPMGFLLVFRAVTEGDYEQFAKPPYTWPCNVMFSTSQGVLFCPWCGTNLRRFYGNRTDLPFVEFSPETSGQT